MTGVAAYSMAVQREALALAAAGDRAQAHRVLTDAIGELRALKLRTVRRKTRMRSMRRTGVGARLAFGALAGHGVRSGTRRARGRGIRRRQDAALRLASVRKAQINAAVMSLDRARAALAAGAAHPNSGPPQSALRSAPPVPPPPPALSRTAPPARWAPDPTGRYQYRYWNGATWTEHVATDGVQTTAPLS